MSFIHLFIDNGSLESMEVRNINDFNKSVELHNEDKYASNTCLSPSSESSATRCIRTLMRAGTAWIPLLQTYLLTVGSILTSSVHMAVWANLRIIAMQRGALLLKFLHAISHTLIHNQNHTQTKNISWLTNVHLMADLREADSIITSDWSQFLFLSAHVSLNRGELYRFLRREMLYTPRNLKLSYNFYRPFLSPPIECYFCNNAIQLRMN